MNKNLIINFSKIRGNKNKILALSLIAIFAVSIVMVFAPTTSAQIGIPQPRPTSGYVAVAPLVCGVGQKLTINVWVQPFPVNYAWASYYSGPNGGSFTGVSVTFTKPDGTKDTFMPTDAIGVYPAGVLDPLSTLYFYYTPNEAGNWSVTMSMPAQNFTDVTGTIQWQACTSPPAYFTVQTAPVNAGLLNGYPYAPLPNANTYWNYPINSNNREWASISGDWLVGTLSSSRYQPYGNFPNTGHILWDIPFGLGGIVGGSYGSISYQPLETSSATTNAYGFASSVIMDGKLFVVNAENTAIESVDLTTGKLLWTQPATLALFGLRGIDLPGNTYVQSFFGKGVTLASSFGSTPTPYLLGNTGTAWNYYDILTGALVFSITNVTGTASFVNGSPLVWGYTQSNLNFVTGVYGTNFVWEWNLSKVVNGDFWTGIVWTHNVKGIGNYGSRPTLLVSADTSAIMYGDGISENTAQGFNANTGASIWNNTYTYASEVGATVLGNTNDYLSYDAVSNTFYCYSILTGQLVWSSSTNVGSYPWNSKLTYVGGLNDNANLYIPYPDGTVTALSLTTGKVVWKSTAIPSSEYTSNAIPFWLGSLVANGNLYLYGGYSTAYEINPIPRFAMLVCINCTTGAITFTLNGGIDPTGASNGYVLGISQLDGNYYCLGKGQTSTVVSVPNNFVEGSTVQIQGSVMDMSPASPNTPAVADSAMSEWMDYLHMQNATSLNNPPKEPGVPVTLTAVDPNNNTVTIGTTTTDSKGNFYYNWSPKTTGSYVITASFDGTGSYWSSSAETGIVVTSTPATSSGSSSGTTTSSGISDTALYTVGAILAIVIVIGFVVSILLLRRRP